MTSTTHFADPAFADPRTVRLSGGPLRVYQAGPPDGPPALLLHGAMLDTAPLTWHALLPHLARSRRVTAIDMPRHGGSRPWRGTMDQQGMESMLDELLDRLEIDRAAMVGLSMGGGVATGYALTRPQRVTALVALSPGGVEDVRPAQHLTWRFLQCERLLRHSTKWITGRRVLRHFNAHHLTKGAQTPGFDAIMRLSLDEARRRLAYGERALDDWQIHSYGPRAMAVNFTPQLHTLAVPSLWLHGVHDNAISGAAVRRAADTAPGGRFSPVERAGHLTPLDEPEVVNALVGDFLAEVDPAKTEH